MARYLPGFCNISDLGQYWETMSDANVTPLVKKLLDSKMLREVDNKYIVDDWVKNVLQDDAMEKEVNQVLAKSDKKLLEAFYMSYRVNNP